MSRERTEVERGGGPGYPGHLKHFGSGERAVCKPDGGKKGTIFRQQHLGKRRVNYRDKKKKKRPHLNY